MTCHSTDLINVSHRTLLIEVYTYASGLYLAAYVYRPGQAEALLSETESYIQPLIPADYLSRQVQYYCGKRLAILPTIRASISSIDET